MSTPILAPDPLAALRTYLLADTKVGPLVSVGVFVNGIPSERAGSMPGGAVSLNAAGGFQLFQNVPVSTPRVDVLCYGASRRSSYVLHLAVQAALRALHREFVGLCLLHVARQESGAAFIVDELTNWPLVLSSWQLFAADQAVPA